MSSNSHSDCFLLCFLLVQNKNKSTSRGGCHPLLSLSHVTCTSCWPEYTKVETASFILKVLHELLKAHSVCRDNQIIMLKCTFIHQQQTGCASSTSGFTKPCGKDSDLLRLLKIQLERSSCFEFIQVGLQELPVYIQTSTDSKLQE